MGAPMGGPALLTLEEPRHSAYWLTCSLPRPPAGSHGERPPAAEAAQHEALAIASCGAQAAPGQHGAQRAECGAPGPPDQRASAWIRFW